jgi:antitoxin (DNA-binding transcriptional repressor) of toxin-antitoxin stability system/predicted nucleic acid-binding protein
MDTLGVEEARRRLPELLSKAEAGEHTIIRRHDRLVAALVPVAQRPAAQARSVLSLHGSGKSFWQAPRSAPAPGPTTQTKAPPFEPHLVPHRSVIAFDAASLIAFLCERRGSKRLLEPLLLGIHQRSWHGLISSLTLARVLAGPLSCGQEQLAQHYKQVFTDPLHWRVLPVDADLAEAAVRLASKSTNISAMEEPSSLPEPAALDLATAIAGGATLLVSDDPHLAQTGILRVVPTGTRA